jgi:hypothetical protein
MPRRGGGVGYISALKKERKYGLMEIGLVCTVPRTNKLFVSEKCFIDQAWYFIMLKASFYCTLEPGTVK